jgi:hypothetical protein
MHIRLMAAWMFFAGLGLGASSPLALFQTGFFCATLCV